MHPFLLLPRRVLFVLMIVLVAVAFCCTFVELGVAVYRHTRQAITDAKAKAAAQQPPAPAAKPAKQP